MSGRTRSRRGLRLVLVVCVVVGITATLSQGQPGPAAGPRAIAASGSVVFVPATAHASGANGASWRTDLEVHNPGGTTASFTVQLLRRDADNASPASRSYTLDAQRSRRFVDVLVSEFGTEGAAALRIAVASGTLFVTSRTYNLVGANPWQLPQGASFGQYVPGWDETRAIANGQEGRLIHLTQQASSTLDGFRTNLGLVNATSSPVDVRVDLYRADGTWLGKKDGGETNLPAYGFRQLNEVFGAFGTVTDGFAVVRPSTAGGKVLAFATVIDNHNSGDPVFIPADRMASASSPTPTPGPTSTPTRTPTATPTPTPTAPAGLRPNLILHRPEAWPACVVIHSLSGCCTSSACCTPSPSTTGSSFVQFVVANTGSATATGTIRFSMAVDGVVAGTASWANSTGLEPGFGVLLTWEFKGAVVPGIHDVTLTVDPENAIAESNEADNACTTTVSWGGAPLLVASLGEEVPAVDTLTSEAPVPLAGKGPRRALEPSTGPIYVPASAHASGVNGASWRTDLEVHNPGSTAVTFDVALLKQGTDNSGTPETHSFSLGPQQSVRYVDVLASLFGFTGAASLRLTSHPWPILVNSRTYNIIGPNPVGLPVGASFGQFVPGLPETEAIGYGEEGRIIQLTHREASTLADFRTNVGFVNTTGNAIDLRVDLFTAEGVLLGTIQDATTHLRPWEFAQVNGIFGRFTDRLEDGYVLVSTATPGGRFFAFATVIDNHLTGDPIFIPAARMASGWVTVGSGTIGSAGGTVSGGGIAVSVPSGAFTGAATLTITRNGDASTPLDRFRTTDVFRLDGLPDDRAKAVTLTLGLTRSAGVAGADFVAAASEVFVPSGASPGSPPMLLKATRSAGQVTASIPAAPAQGPASEAGHGALAAAADEKSQVTIWAITGYAELLSAEGHFRVNYPVTDLVLSGAEEVARGLETAYSKIAGLGFEWTRRTSWPVYVSIAPFPAATNARLAECAPSRWGVNSYWLHVNANRLNLPADIPLMRDATAHELFHLVQYLYDPRNRITMARDPGIWYWADEATAVWFENHFNGSSIPPQVVRENHFFMKLRGLEFASDDSGAVQDHGYGAAQLVRDLAMRKGDGAVGTFVRARANSQVLPVDAYDTVTGLNAPSTWRLFVDEYLRGHLYSGVPTAADAWLNSSGNRYTFAAEGDGGTTFTWNAADLSARFYGLQFTDPAWASGTPLTLTLTDPAKDAIALVYTVRSGQLASVGYLLDGQTFTVPGADAFASSQTSLLVAVANGRAVRPYTGTTPVSLKASRPVPESPLSKTKYFDVRWSGHVYMTGPGGALWDCASSYGFCPQFGGGNRYFPTDQKLTWSGRSFTIRYSGTTNPPGGGSDNGTREVTFSGTVDSTATKLLTATYTSTWTCKESFCHYADLVKEEFTLTDVPVSYGTTFRLEGPNLGSHVSGVVYTYGGNYTFHHVDWATSAYIEVSFGSEPGPGGNA